MSDWVMGGRALAVAIVIIVLLGVPLVLAWAAGGRVTRHRGRTACVGCGYELAGLAVGDEQRCPECGAGLAAENVALEGSSRYRPASLWVTVPVIALLMLPTTAMVHAILAIVSGLSTGTAAWVVWPLYPVSVWWLVRKNLEQQRERARLEARIEAKRERMWEEAGQAREREKEIRDEQVRGAMVTDAAGAGQGGDGRQTSG